MSDNPKKYRPRKGGGCDGGPLPDHVQRLVDAANKADPPKPPKVIGEYRYPVGTGWGLRKVYTAPEVKT